MVLDALFYTVAAIDEASSPVPTTTTTTTTTLGSYVHAHRAKCHWSLANNSPPTSQKSQTSVR